MKKGSIEFKKKFDELSQQMLDLINKSSPEDLAKEGIHVIQPAPKIPVLPKDEKEFLRGLIEFIARTWRKPLVPNILSSTLPLLDRPVYESRSILTLRFLLQMVCLLCYPTRDTSFQTCLRQ